MSVDSLTPLYMLVIVKKIKKRICIKLRKSQFRSHFQMLFGAVAENAMFHVYMHLLALLAFSNAKLRFHFCSADH